MVSEDWSPWLQSKGMAVGITEISHLDPKVGGTTWYFRLCWFPKGGLTPSEEQMGCWKGELQGMGVREMKKCKTEKKIKFKKTKWRQTTE